MDERPTAFETQPVPAASEPAPEKISLVLERLFATLEDRGVRWALLRDPPGGLSAPEGSIDLLVHPADLGLAGAALRSRAFARRPGDEAPGGDYFRYEESSDQWFRVHIETSLSFGPRYPIPLEGPDGAFGRTELRQGVRRLDGNTAFWLLLWDGLSRDGRVASYRAFTLRQLYPAVDPRRPIAKLFADAVGDPAILKRIPACVRSSDWTEVEGVVPHLAAEPEPPPAPRGERLRAWLRRTADRISDHGRRRGLSVAVIGPAGAGKTTLVHGLNATVPLPCLTVDLGVTEGRFGRIAGLPIPGVRFLVLAILVWARYLRARYWQERGRIVLFDRYPYDASAPYRDHITDGQWVERRLARYLCPRPDFVFLLDAPGAVMFERTGKSSPAILEDCRWFFRQLRNRIPRAIVLDAARDPDSVRVEATTRIWRRLTTRWEV